MEIDAAPKLSKYMTALGGNNVKSFTYEINQHMHVHAQTHPHTYTLTHTHTHHTHTHTHTSAHVRYSVLNWSMLINTTQEKNLWVFIYI